jgi:hypothetical protein
MASSDKPASTPVGEPTQYTFSNVLDATFAPNPLNRSIVTLTVKVQTVDYNAEIRVFTGVLLLGKTTLSHAQVEESVAWGSSKKVYRPCAKITLTECARTDGVLDTASTVVISLVGADSTALQGIAGYIYGVPPAKRSSYDDGY